MTDVLEKHFDDMTGLALSLCGRQDLAADVVQQTCLKAWAARNSYDQSLPAKPWLLRILKNEFLQIIRKPTPFTNVDEAVFEAGISVAQRAHCEAESLALWQCFSMLPDEQRLAVTLVVAMGFSYDEAAEFCDCSAGTIKSRVSRGKHRIRETLGHRNEPDNSGS